MVSKNSSAQAWPELPFEAFRPTAYLLHRAAQMMGKFKLTTPFQPHWDNVPLWVTSRGLTTGLIPYQERAFSIDLDLIKHRLSCTATNDQSAGFEITAMPVADFAQNLLSCLKQIGVDIRINLKPQEVPDPIPFDQDTQSRPYNAALANAWWRILVSTQAVMMRYHAQFLGRTPPIGLMWGTFDLRDVRYSGKPVPTEGKNLDYITRKAMDAEMIEMGWWSGDQRYPQPAYFSFIFPPPAGIDQAKIEPKAAHWDPKLSEFILNYDDVRQSKNPAQTLLDFMLSCYRASTSLANWNPALTIFQRG